MRNEIYSGTLKITLEMSGDGPSAAVSGGDARIDGGAWDWLNVCNPANQPGRAAGWGMPQTTMSGTAARVTFSSSDSPQSGDNSGPINRTFTFSGTLSGDTITGTYAMTWRGTLGGFDVQSPVTLARTK